MRTKVPKIGTYREARLSQSRMGEPRTGPIRRYAIPRGTSMVALFDGSPRAGLAVLVHCVFVLCHLPIYQHFQPREVNSTSLPHELHLRHGVRVKRLLVGLNVLSEGL